MPDILIRGIGLPKGETAELNIRIKPDGTILNHVGIHLRERAIELSPHGDLIETKDVLLALVEHGQRDKRFKLGDTIRYSPSEVKEIIDASVPVVVPADKEETE